MDIVQASTSAPHKACDACGLDHDLPTLESGEFASCSRCGTLLATGSPRLSSRNAVALSLSAFVMWALALWLPLAEVKKMGLTNRGYLYEIGSSFRENDQFLLGIVTDLLVLVLPSVLFCLLPVIALSRLIGGTFPGRSLAIRACSFAKQWAMPEVFVLSILVAFLKIGALANASIEIGFYFLSVAILLMIYMLPKFRVFMPHHKKNIATSVSLFIAAALLLVPANVLPIMIVNNPTGSHGSTILKGVEGLVEHGFWFIASIVFVASILVPFGKLGSLAWLFYLSRKGQGSKQAVKTYALLEFVGRWSMLDIFLIGVLAGLIDFGKLSTIQPGPAAPAFAAAVILTVIAVERFDTKRLFAKSVA